ncbi:hypothetical protein BH11PSE4_BH11PSE4_11000 [soil metagenome]
MIKKYVSKFLSDILPSVIATIIGAYIVNHYIVIKPDPSSAAIASKKPEDVKFGDAPATTASIPDAGKAAGGEKAAAENGAVDKPAAAKASEKWPDKASGRHTPAPRDKAVAKASAPVSAPVTATPVTTAPAATEPAQDERRDANDLARAAIERLRASTPVRPEGPARVQETARGLDMPRPTEPEHAAATLVQPLPPAVTVPATIPVGLPANVAGASPLTSNGPSDLSAARNENPPRLSPPAEIPARPIDLRAEIAVAPRTSVAEDVLLAARSVFHTVLPRWSTGRAEAIDRER